MKNRDITQEVMRALPSLITLSEGLYAGLSGEDGENRETNQRCQIQAKNDYEAIQCWLNEYKHKITTFKTYQKESERFLLWAIIQKEKPLSSLNRDDLECYLQFLDDPQPKEVWCRKKSGRGCKRGDPNWRPFIRGLSINAKSTAISSIDSLFNYLVEAHYLTFNPLSLIRKRYAKSYPSKAREISLQERMLTLNEWHAMLDTLESMPEKTEKEKFEKERLAFLIKILFFLGLRINELETHSWNAFRKIDDDWWFYVVGKGNKVGRIPVNDELLYAVITYRDYLKKFPYPNTDETIPLITAFKKDKAITARQINKILKQLAIKTAKRFNTQPDKMKKLKKFSAHWIRHFSASMQDRVGIAFKHIRANHRHEKDETTRLYIHSINNDRHSDMQKLKLKINK